MIDAIGFSAARETFAFFDEELRPLTAGILWSDSRAEREADELGDRLAFRAADRRGAERLRAMPAKVAWVARTAPDVLDRARWILHPRDLVVARMTGVVVTDETLAFAHRLVRADRRVASERASQSYGERLPSDRSRRRRSSAKSRRKRRACSDCPDRRAW